MLLAIKGNNTTYLGIAKQDYLTENEGMLIENIPICFGAKGTKSLIAFSESTMVTDLLQMDEDFTSKEMTYDNLIKYLIPEMFKVSKMYGQLKDGKLTFFTIVCHDNEIFDILQDGSVNQLDKSSSKYCSMFFSLYNNTEGQEPIQRIRNIYRILEKVDGTKLFPIHIFEASTGKRFTFKN